MLIDDDQPLIEVPNKKERDEAWTARFKIQDSQFFSKILTVTHPLCQEVVRSIVRPRPGIYLISKPQSLQVIYVGRSDCNLQQRLIQHCRKRDYFGLQFSFFNTKNRLESYRLESRAIFYFNRIDRLTNQVNAAFPKKPP